LRYAFAWEPEAAALEQAVERALAEGLRTRDLDGAASTADATREVIACL
jgi:3-isopropylmalate dehydrogenase